ncbi:MAG: PDZ domain-containing protein [bacterium]|nr:PDZ domain-containing protein [bacterium]
MLKGLLIRQVFLAVDLALAGLMVFVVYLVVMQTFGTKEDVLAEGGPGASLVLGDDLDIDTPGPRNQYDGLVASGLFGDAASLIGPSVGPVEEPPPTEAEAPKTLRLWGTATFQERAAAVIENAAAKTVKKINTFFVGDPVTEVHTLIEVYPRKAVLMNSQLNQREILEMAADDAPVIPQATAVSRADARRNQGARGYSTVSRNEVVTEMSVKGDALVKAAQPRMATDDAGNIIGITSDNLNNVPLAKKVGLKSGDIVQSVNGITIDSEDRIAEIFHRFQNATVFRLGVLRGGKQEMLNIKLE